MPTRAGTGQEEVPENRGPHGGLSSSRPGGQGSGAGLLGRKTSSPKCLETQTVHSGLGGCCSELGEGRAHEARTGRSEGQASPAQVLEGQGHPKEESELCLYQLDHGGLRNPRQVAEALNLPQVQAQV